MPFDFASVRESFFDSKKVVAEVSAKDRKAQSKMGAFVRRRAKSLLRYRKKPSPPGSPPSVHRTDSFTRTTVNRKTGEAKTRGTSPLKELLFFAYDASTKSTVIGPAIFRRSPALIEALEKGGEITATRAVKTVRGRKASSRAQAESFRRKVQDGSIVLPKQARERVTIRVAKRPTMAPALAAELSKFAELYRG